MKTVENMGFQIFRQEHECQLLSEGHYGFGISEVYNQINFVFCTPIPRAKGLSEVLKGKTTYYE